MTANRNLENPQQKLDQLRAEFRDKGGYGPRRVNALVSVELAVPMMTLRGGNRVMAFVEVRVHSTEPMPDSPDELWTAIACELAASRLRKSLQLREE